MVEERASGEAGEPLPAIAIPRSKDQGEQPADDALVKRTKQDVERELSRKTSEVRIFADKLEPAMEQTSRYVVRRGLLILLAVQPFYKALQRISKYQDGKPIRFKGPLLIIALLALYEPRIRLTYCKPQLVLDSGKLTLSLSARSWVRVLAFVVPKFLRSRLEAKVAKVTQEPVFHADLTPEMSAPVILILLILISILGSLVILLNIPRYVAWTLVRGLTITFRSALRTLPSLFAILVVIFITSDTWKMFGRESSWQFATMIIFITVTSIAAVIVTLRGSKGDWRSICGYSAEKSTLLKDWATDKTPAGTLVSTDGVKPLLPPFPSKDSQGWNKLLKAHEKNISILYFATIISHVIAVAFWISLTFVLIGVITVNAGMTNELSNSHADILHQFNVAGQQFIVTRQLVLTSVIIGGIATLTFVSGTLQDADHRQEFADYALTDFRRGIGALAYYYGAVIALLRAEFGHLFTPEGISNLQERISAVVSAMARAAF